MIGPQDERPHEVGGDRAWSESYYFAFFGERMSGITRIGVRPNEGTQDVLVVCYPAGGGIAVARELREQRENTGDLTVGDVTYECLEPLRRWRIRSKGSLRALADPRLLLGEVPDADGGGVEQRTILVDLEFDAFTDAAEASVTGDEGAMARTAAGHFEQAGVVNGTVDGEPFHGLGWRDKSWGVRDWSAPEMWRWFAIPFGEDLAVNALVLRMGGMEISGGWAWHEGRVKGVSDVWVDTETGPDNRTHRRLDLAFVVDDGPALQVHGEVQAIAPLPLTADGKTTLVNEGLTRFTLPDGRSALGIAEYLHQLTGDPAAERIAHAAGMLA